MSVASFIGKTFEQTYNNKNSAIYHVMNNGYSNATIEELETMLQRMADDDMPAEIYGRTWIPAHFERM